MPAADPIPDYHAFRRYRVPIREYDQRAPLVLKIWVRSSGPETMASQANLVRLVREQTAVPTPEWIHVRPGDDLIPYPYSVMECAAGEDADALWRSLDGGQRSRLLGECARALHTLHSSDLKGSGPADAAAWAAAETERFHDAIDFDNATMAPPFTDARVLTLSVFLEDPESAMGLWHAYGELKDRQLEILRLHCLGRVLTILAAYQGPAPGGWNAGKVEALLRELGRLHAKAPR